MEYTKLGNTGVDVSRICLGCMGFGDAEHWVHKWVLNEEDSRPIIQKALELGVNFFDTANVYSIGKSEEILGRALKDFANRDEIVIATKVRGRMFAGSNGEGLSRKAILSELDKSLKRIETDYVDLYQIHRWDYQTPIEETMEVLHDVVRAGRFGTSVPPPCSHGSSRRHSTLPKSMGGPVSWPCRILRGEGGQLHTLFTIPISPPDCPPRIGLSGAGQRLRTELRDKSFVIFRRVDPAPGMADDADLNAPAHRQNSKLFQLFRFLDPIGRQIGKLQKRFAAVSVKSQMVEEELRIFREVGRSIANVRNRAAAEVHRPALPIADDFDHIGTAIGVERTNRHGKGRQLGIRIARQQIGQQVE